MPITRPFLRPSSEKRRNGFEDSAAAQGKTPSAARPPQALRGQARGRLSRPGPRCWEVTIALIMDESTVMKIRFVSARRSKLAKGLVLVLSGGSLLTTCQGRFRQAVVDGGKTLFFTTLLDPKPFVNQIVGTNSDATSADGASFDPAAIFQP